MNIECNIKFNIDDKCFCNKCDDTKFLHYITPAFKIK